MNTAVLYLRKSTNREGKQEATIPTQRENLHAYAEKDGFRVVREYVD